MEKWEGHRRYKIGHGLRIVETGWCIHGGLLHYTLFLYVLEISLDKMVKEKKGLVENVPFQLSSDLSMCYIRIMENTVWLKMNHVNYQHIRDTRYHCPS